MDDADLRADALVVVDVQRALVTGDRTGAGRRDRRATGLVTGGEGVEAALRGDIRTGRVPTDVPW